ncbi:N-acyl amino acid synthase FeeM domain-containing protein [Anaeromyxobacter terrae]|uniref:N-acyl amino acid synthase FeeM domain-containing protein n=1 Tax=Anaeromyxobacter terrae TaxID=2925406 RepID=UPI001F5A1344|nr:GNAT family N-acyltransferase [Anaeromyxobacter sp. SG22]
MRIPTWSADASARPAEDATPLPRRFDAADPEASLARVHALGPRDPVHGAVLPGDVRPGDPVFAQVRVAGAPGPGASGQVWRMSPLGVELVRSPALAAVSPGDALDLTLRVGGSVSSFTGLRVAAVRIDRGREIVALRWSEAGPADEEGAPGEKRSSSRFACERDWLPTGVTPNAVRYDDQIHFRIADISRTGMQLVTSLRNKFLIPGVEFTGTCTFPTMGQAEIAFRVVRVRIAQHGAKRCLALGVTWSVPDPRTRELVGQYLLQFGPGTSVQELRETGFHVRSSSRALDFGAVRTEEEYREVLALRRIAYLRAGKVGSGARDEDMADALDARSRILVAKYRGRIVACVRLLFPPTPDSPLKHEDYLTLPSGAPPRDEIVELSKFCTHPDFRGSDLFYTLVKHCALTTMQSGRRYAVMSCTDELVKPYGRVGFRKLGASYVHPTMKLEHHLMMAEVARVVSGKHVNPVIWNLMGGWELWSFARLCGVAPGSRLLDARVAVWRLFGPAARAALALHLKRKGARGWRR